MILLNWFLLLTIISQTVSVTNTKNVLGSMIYASNQSNKVDQQIKKVNDAVVLPSVLSTPSQGYYVLINVSQNWEEVFLDGKLLERNLVSSGSPARFGFGAGTPLGKFRIASKIATDPQGEYGPYYLGLEKWENGGWIRTDIGLHGTNEPGLIGQDASHGCVRHNNEVIARLANLLPIGTMVEIVE